MRKLLFIICLLCLVSCKTKYIEVPRTSIQYVTKTSVDTLQKLDSIYILDSVYVRQQNDTVYKDKIKTIFKYKDKYIYSNKVDTVNRVDSIPYKVETIKYVNKTNKIQQLLIYIGLCALVLLVVYIIRVFNKK